MKKETKLDLIIGILVSLITISGIFLGIAYNKSSKLDNNILEDQLTASIGFMDALRYRMASLNYDFYILSNLCNDSLFRLTINQETMDPSFANDLEINLSKMYENEEITCIQYLQIKRKIYEESYLERFNQIQDLGKEYIQLKEKRSRVSIWITILIFISIICSIAILIVYLMILNKYKK